MSWRQLQEWIVFADLEPFDEVRADLRSAQLAMILANAYRDKKKKRQPYSMDDVLLRWGDSVIAKPKQTWQQKKAILKGMYMLFKAREDKRVGKQSTAAGRAQASRRAGRQARPGMRRRAQ